MRKEGKEGGREGRNACSCSRISERKYEREGGRVRGGMVRVRVKKLVIEKKKGEEED